MKTTKVILMAAVLGAAAMSANAGVHFGFSVGLPVPVVVAPPVVVAAPAPVVVAPAPVVETVPACPGVDYVWSPGYWSAGHVWVGGGWNHRPGYYYAHRDYGYRYGYGYHYGHRW
jgi:hypothetical protein